MNPLGCDTGGVQQYDVVLPAGGRIMGDYALEVGTVVKALVPIGHQPVIQRILLALRDSGVIKRSVVVGPVQVQDHHAMEFATATVPEGATGPENILRGIEWLQRNNGGEPLGRILIVTTDLPFLTPAVIQRFVDSCPDQYDWCVPLVSQGAYHTMFPSAPGTFVNLMDGSYTLGCIYLVNADAIIANRDRIENIFQVRKNKLAMANQLGAAFLFKYMTKRLTVNDVIAQVEKLSGCTIHPIRNGSPETAFDIDDLDDYQYAIQKLGIEPE